MTTEGALRPRLLERGAGLGRHPERRGLRSRVRPAARAQLVRVALVAAVPGLTVWADAPRPPNDLVVSMPARRATAPTGSRLVARLARASAEERARSFVDEVFQGNVPGHLRRLRPVEMSMPVPGGVPVRGVVWCMPDYLAVGSDDDFVRVPLGLPDALAVARRLGLVLPTRRIVDAIHAAAEVKVDPRPMPPGPAMTSIAWLWSHSRAIDAQLRGVPRGTLVAGMKKDVVLTPRLASSPKRVAIYGWHRLDGAAIQPLSTVHGARYADYSHGVRLVSGIVLVDGRALSVLDVLADPALFALVGDEGPDPEARCLLSPP